MSRPRRAVWVGLAVLVLAQIGYPLVEGVTRARLVVVTVVLGYLISVTHCALSRGVRSAGWLVLVTTGGGLAVEATGVATGVPFGTYSYGSALGPPVLGVPLVIPLAWTWMAWPAWVVAGRLVPGWWRIPVAAAGLASWDLFLDPQMVAERYWTWAGTTEVPLTNYLGWLAVALVLMTLMYPVPARHPDDAPMYALYLWTYFSGILAHAVFLGLPASAAWGALGMGAVAIPLLLAQRRVLLAQLRGGCGLRRPWRAQPPRSRDDRGAGT